MFKPRLKSVECWVSEVESEPRTSQLISRGKKKGQERRWGKKQSLGADSPRGCAGRTIKPDTEDRPPTKGKKAVAIRRPVF